MYHQPNMSLSHIKVHIEKFYCILFHYLKKTELIGNHEQKHDDHESMYYYYSIATI